MSIVITCPITDTLIENGDSVFAVKILRHKIHKVEHWPGLKQCILAIQEYKEFPEEMKPFLSSQVVNPFVKSTIGIWVENHESIGFREEDYKAMLLVYRKDAVELLMGEIAFSDEFFFDLFFKIVYELRKDPINDDQLGSSCPEDSDLQTQIAINELSNKILNEKLRKRSE